MQYSIPRRSQPSTLEWAYQHRRTCHNGLPKSCRSSAEYDMRRWRLKRSQRAWIKTPGLRTPLFLMKRYGKIIRKKTAKYKWQRTNIRQELRGGGSGWRNLADFWRAVKHPRIWWHNIYWVGKGGTNRKSECKYRLNVRRTRPRPDWAIRK